MMGFDMRDTARESLCLDWSPPPANGRMKLPAGEAHVWQGSVSAWAGRLDRLVGVLSDDERTRGEQYRLEADRLRFLIGRGLLRQVLGRYLEAGVFAGKFILGASGKPSLPADFVLEFNVSHSGDLILIAVAAGRRVGIDVEKIEGAIDVMKLAAESCSAGEMTELAALGEVDQRAHFFRLWTGKEAFLKATGDGFSRMTGVDVELSKLQEWQCRELAVDPNYAAAIVIEGGVTVFRGWDADELVLPSIG